MCGIAGIINFDANEDVKGLLGRMIELMRHRGPDGTGFFIKGPAGLGHARLSIIDLTSGDQPIHNEDKNLWVVFNGEIYNYPELRAELISRNHRFYTRSDTEVLVHLYEDKGVDMLNDLNGQFAFGIWNQKKKELFLARDRVGVRPLFYHKSRGRLIFGSEIKSIFADGHIGRSMDIQTLSDIFTCWAPIGSRTPFKDVYQIPPGHYGLFSEAGMSIRPYWELSRPFAATTSDDGQRSLAEWTEDLGTTLLDAVRLRLRADVPVGAYLSGGLDSTLISALIKRNFNNLLRTFSVSFTDKRFDETTFQSIAVKALNTEHRDIRCAEKDIGEIFPKVVWHSESPLFRTAPAPLYQLSKLVRENNFKVVLTGEGADEFFAGYNIFKENKVRRFWAQNPQSKLRPRLLERLYPYIFSQGNEKGSAFLTGFFKKNLLDIDSPVYSHMLRWKNTSQLKAFFSKDLQKEVETADAFIERYKSTLPSDFMSWHPLSRAQYIEVSIFLSNYLLSSQGDRMAMANSVEGRFPFLDHRVIELAGSVPAVFRISGLREKYILKKVADGLIPSELIERPKQPYRAPISKCFFGNHEPDYVTELLSDNSLKQSGYFDSEKVAGLVKKCRQQEGHLLSERENMALVGILSTQLLHHQFIQNFPVPFSHI